MRDEMAGLPQTRVRRRPAASSWGANTSYAGAVRALPTRLATAIGVDLGDLVVFGLLPITLAVVEPLVFHAPSNTGALLAIAAIAGAAGVTAGRRRYSPMQVAWYIAVAIVALFIWELLTVAVVIELGIR